MSNVTYGSDDAVVARMPSPSLWNDCPVEVLKRDPAKGQHYFNDFHQAVVGGSTLVLGQPGGLTAYLESNAAGDLAVVASQAGEMDMVADGTDQDVYCVTSGDNVAGKFLTPTAGAAKNFWFEARVKVSTITDGDIGLFVGLAQPGEAKDAGGVFGGDAAALADVDYVGFAILEGDGDALRLVYNEATSGVAQSAAAATVAADTYVRVGFKVTTGVKGRKVLRWFINGAELSTDNDVDLNKANANWPGNTAMDLVLSLVGGTSAADGDKLTVDWIRVAHEL